MELVSQNGVAVFGKVESTIKKLLEEEGRLQREINGSDGRIQHMNVEKVRRRNNLEAVKLAINSIVTEEDEEETYNNAASEIEKSERRLCNLHFALATCVEGIENLGRFTRNGELELFMLEDAYTMVVTDIQNHEAKIAELLGSAEAYEKNLAGTRSLSLILSSEKVELENDRKKLVESFEMTRKRRYGCNNALREATAAKKQLSLAVHNAEHKLENFRSRRNQLNARLTDLESAIGNATTASDALVRSCRSLEEDCRLKKEEIKRILVEEARLRENIDSNATDYRECLAEMCNLDSEKDKLESKLDSLEDDYADAVAVHAQFEEECKLIRVVLNTKKTESEENHAVKEGLIQKQQLLDSELIILEAELIELENRMTTLHSVAGSLGLESGILKQKISTTQDDKYQAEEELYTVETGITQLNDSISEAKLLVEKQEEKILEAQTSLSAMDIEKLEISVKYAAAADSLDTMHNDSSPLELRKKRNMLAAELLEERALQERILTQIAEIQEEVPKLNSEIQSLTTDIEDIKLEAIEHDKLSDNNKFRLEQEVRLLEIEHETKRELLEKAQASLENIRMTSEEFKSQVEAVSAKLSVLQQQVLHVGEGLSDRKASREFNLEALSSAHDDLQTSVQQVTKQLESTGIENQEMLVELEQLRKEESSLVEAQSEDIKSVAELKDRIQSLEAAEREQDMLIKDRTEQTRLALGNREQIVSEYEEKIASAQALLNSEIANEEQLQVELQNCRSRLLALERSMALELSLKQDLSGDLDVVNAKMKEQELNSSNENTNQKRLKEIKEQRLQFNKMFQKMKADLDTEEKLFTEVQQENQALKSSIQDTEEAAVRDPQLESEKENLRQIKLQIRCLEIGKAIDSSRDLERQRLCVVEKLSISKKKKEKYGFELTTLREKLETVRAHIDRLKEDLKDMAYPFISKNQGEGRKLHSNVRNSDQANVSQFSSRKQSPMKQQGMAYCVSFEHTPGALSSGRQEKLSKVATESFKLPVSYRNAKPLDQKDTSGYSGRKVNGPQLSNPPLKSILKRPMPTSFGMPTKGVQKSSSNAYTRDNGSKALKLSTPGNPYDFDDSDSAEDWSQFKAKERARVKAKKVNEEGKAKSSELL